MPSPDNLPPALPSMWRALKRAYEVEPRLLGVSFSLASLAALPDALLALWMKLLADGMRHGHRDSIIAAAIGLALSAVATWFLKVTSDRTQRRFRDPPGSASVQHGHQRSTRQGGARHADRRSPREAAS